jgi:N4-gp56 family major capsid protein
MTDTTVPIALRVKQWDSNYFAEWVRANQFSKYMGTGSSSLIQLREDLTKKKGDTIVFQLINRLTGTPITDNSVLNGFEEDLTQRSFSVTVHQYRNAVVVPDYEQQASILDLLTVAKEPLMDWGMSLLRDKIIAALASKNGIPFANAGNGTTGTTEAQKDAWLVDNHDRALFGAAVANSVSDVWATAAGLVDASADKLTYTVVSLAKRMAKTADPHIRPIRDTKDGQEWFVLFCNSRCFRDLKASLATIHQNAEVRGSSNPLFTDGDLVWDGVICREVPEMGTMGAVGDSSSVVAENYLCGAQALGLAFARRWQSITKKEDDYGDKPGVGVRGTWGVEKLRFGKGSTDTADYVDQGVVTLLNTAVADA